LTHSEETAQEKERIIQLLHDRLTAIVRNDRARLEELIHDQYFYITSVGVCYNKRQFIDGFTNQPGPQLFETQPEIVSIEIEGNIATVVSNLRGAFWVAGRPFSQSSYPVSHTLIKQDGKWKFLAGHFM